MKTLDLFKTDRTAAKLNESLSKAFGKKLNLESFDLPQLEDARNKLRTQVYTARSQSNFNETVENEALTQAQWMLDTINAEIAERQELIADAHTAELEVGDTNEGFGSLEDEVMKLLKRFDENANEIGAYGDPDINKIIALLQQGDFEGATEEVWYSYSDQDGGEVPQIEPYVDDLGDEFKVLAQGGDEDTEPDDNTDDSYALASAGHGSDEDYESVQLEKAPPGKAYGGSAQKDDEDKDELEEGKFKEIYTDMMDYATKKGYSSHKQFTPADYDALAKPHGISGKELAVSLGHKKASQVAEVAPPGAKAERMVKHIKAGYAKDGKLTDKEKGIAYATAWKQHNKNESIEGDNMATLREGEIQQAQSIVTAKTMVDRVGRWIEELSGMENDTLLQLGDQIRDEQGQEAAKMFISSVAPAIQQALENLKSTREALASGVRTLTGEEQSAGMLGAEPEAAPVDDFGGEADPDAMNAEVPAGNEEVPADDFAAAEPAAGGLGDAGRAKRESIERSNSLLKVLAG